MNAGLRAPWSHRRSLPAFAALALVAGVVAIASVGSGGDDGAAPSATGDRATSLVASTGPATTTTTLPPTTTTAPKTTLSSSLRAGMSGAEVERLQQRLTDLGFRIGPVDGYFGDLTTGAVWAYETLVMGTAFNEVTGVVTPDMWLALQDPLPIYALRPDAGKHTEIYLPKQALVVWDGNTPLFISHISSGELAPPGDDFNRGQEWCAEVTIDPGEPGNLDGTEPLKKGVCGNAWTPGGVYEFYRKHEGNRESRLGGMLNPVYFNYGIAVHGAYNVPDEPASHGCIRIPNLISKDFQDLVQIGEKVYVFDGVAEPESYGSPSGIWDWDDPDYTTTTLTPPPTAPAPTVAATSGPATTRATAPPTTRATAPPTTRATAPPTTRATPPPTTRATPPPTTATTAPPANSLPG